MPQMNKGGKFIYGISVVCSDGGVQFPTQAIKEYRIADEGKIYLFNGSKSTGGFCVTRQGLLLPSKLGHILTEVPELLHYKAPMGIFPLVSVPTIIGCVGALLIIVAAIATPIAKTQRAREVWFFLMSGGAVLKIVTMEIARIFL